MRTIEKRIAAVEERQGPRSSESYRVFCCAVGTDYETFRNQCQAEAGDAKVMIIRFVMPGEAAAVARA